MIRSSRVGVVLAAACLLVTSYSSAGPADPTPTAGPIPLPYTVQVLEVDSGRGGGIPITGQIVSATSSDTDLVNIVPNPLYQGVSFQCIQGKKGVAAITVKTKDAAGKEDSRIFVVACGVTIDKNLTVTTEQFSWTTIGPFPDEYLGQDVKVFLGGIGDWTGIGEFYFNPTTAGTSIILLNLNKQGGGTDYWLVTIQATPTRASQVQIPEQRTAQVVLQPNQCPVGLPLDPRTTRVATPEQYAGAGFERQAAALRTAGVTSIAESNCTSREGPTGLWRIGSFAARVNVNPVTHEGMLPAFRVVSDLFRAKTRDFKILPLSGAKFGDQQEGWKAAFTLSSGQRNSLLGYTARHGNLIYGVMGQGEVRSVPTPPETMIRQYMQIMKGNLDGVLR